MLQNWLSEQWLNTRDNVPVWPHVASCSGKAEVAKVMSHDAFRPRVQDGHGAWRNSTVWTSVQPSKPQFKSKVCLLLNNLNKRHPAHIVEDCTVVLVCMVRKAAPEVFRGRRGRDEPGGQVDNENQRAGNDSNRERKEALEGATPRHDLLSTGT